MWIHCKSLSILIQQWENEPKFTILRLKCNNLLFFFWMTSFGPLLVWGTLDDYTMKTISDSHTKATTPQHVHHRILRSSYSSLPDSGCTTSPVTGAKFDLFCVHHQPGSFSLFKPITQRNTDNNLKRSFRDWTSHPASKKMGMTQCKHIY